MNSLDTNILLYASNTACSEHERARAVVDLLLAKPGDWIIVDQVLLEFYRAMRNPKVLARPRSAGEAARLIHFYRAEAGCAHVGYEEAAWKLIYPWLEKSSFPASRTFDAQLAATLRHHGVTRFYTRNTKDFSGFGFKDVINPLD
ncbi:MAG: TA system VapC family ribonuclease toxin [Candidatus Methylacidiphilales bacterium]|nr:TA system VapC family ribonuclease toxin [Candidatus Methylacidiphilales bacterium]